MLTFDFETEAIVGNPIHRPPRPVGVSIKLYGCGSRYYAWGHPKDNNCTFEEAKAALLKVMREQSAWLAHNREFEAAVNRHYFGVTKRNTLAFHDTQFLVFLHDPYAMKLGLKPSAERILGMKPDEQDELRDWILRNVPQAKASDWGAYIAKAPGSLVGKYAGDSERTGVPGDTDRTYDLFQFLMPQIEARGMLEAYQRELKLCPILSESTVRGTRVDLPKLQEDIGVYYGAKKAAEDYIHKSLGEFNIDSDRDFAEALDRAGQVTEWVLTPTGKRSTARKNLAGRIKDPALLEAVAYRGIMSTCLGTFAEPWLDSAARNQSRLHPQWNQVRGDRGEGGDLSGTRTGRMSCRDPNLQNIPNDFDGVSIPQCVTAMLDYHRSRGWEGTDIIRMRRYLLPEEGHIWLKRDFSAQEMRIMAHFAEGKLYEAYKQDPNVDPHAMVQGMLRDMLGIDLPRKFLKIIAFGIMYGRGIPNLSAALGISPEEGKRFRDAYYTLLPEVRELSYATRDCGKRMEPIRTWGGRQYYREPDPTGRDLSYKLLNYLIQGSAADQTKESAIEWYENKGPDDCLICLVHDEDNISAPIDEAPRAMRILREAMDAPRFDVPFRSEGFAGPNWADIEEYNDAN